MRVLVLGIGYKEGTRTKTTADSRGPVKLVEIADEAATATFLRPFISGVDGLYWDTPATSRTGRRDATPALTMTVSRPPQAAMYQL
jgi:hypothetical protein